MGSNCLRGWRQTAFTLDRDEEMKLTKTLLAGAILAGIGGTAYAETSVTLYGLIDVGITYQRGKVGTEDANRGQYGGDYQSRIGKIGRAQVLQSLRRQSPDV